MSGLTTSFLLPAAAQVALASCKTTVVIAIVLLSRRWLATRMPASIRHVLWLGVVASLLLPGGFDLPVPWLGLPAATVPGQLATVAVADGAGVPDSRPINGGEPDARGFAPLFAEARPPVVASPVVQSTPVAESVRVGLAWLWVIGALAVSAVPAWNLLRYRRIVARAAPLWGESLQLLDQCRAHAGVRRSVRLFESAEVPAPAVLGWVSPALLLPPGMSGRLDASQLRHVFLHELAHVRRHDILTNWLATLAQALHWFNPFVWLALRAMRADMEQACDARVLRWLPANERSSYGRTLIDLLDGFPGRVPVHGLGIVEGQAQLRERITLIARFGSRRATSPALVAMLVLGVTAVAAVQPRFDGRTITSMNEALPVIVSGVKAAASSEPESASGAPGFEAALAADDTPESATATMPAAPTATPSAAMAAQNSRPAASSGVTDVPAPTAFTVRLRTPGNAPVDGASNHFPDNYIFALASRLRAVPGLTLIAPDSTPGADQSTDYEIAIVSNDQPWAVMMVRSFGEEGSRRAGRVARMLEEGLLPSGYRFQAGDTVQDLERNVEEIRMSLFPPDTDLQRQLAATLLDTQAPFSRRLHALELLLKFGVPPGSTADPAVARRGAAFASTLTDPREIAQVWGRLSEAGSPEFPALLAEALAGEGSEPRLLLMRIWGAEYADEPQFRAALQDIAESDPATETRAVAQQLLSGSGA